MPRFYFNVYDDVLARDDEGMELKDVQAARGEARCGAAELIAAQIKGGHQINLSHCIKVENEERQVLFVLSFRELVDFSSL